MEAIPCDQPFDERTSQKPPSSPALHLLGPLAHNIHATHRLHVTIPRPATSSPTALLLRVLPSSYIPAFCIASPSVVGFVWKLAISSILGERVLRHLLSEEFTQRLPSSLMFVVTSFSFETMSSNSFMKSWYHSHDTVVLPEAPGNMTVSLRS